MKVGMQRGQFLAPNTDLFECWYLNKFYYEFINCVECKPSLTKILLFCFQYIFGEFSPDEFNQFFVTPRCSVEVRSTLNFYQK